MKKHYINAVLELITSGKETDEVLKGLKKALETKGHSRLYASILRGVEMQLAAGNATNEPIVILSNEADANEQKEAIEASLKEIEAEGQHTTITDESIIGGHIVSYNNMTIDRSYKTALTNLYRSITK